MIARARHRRRRARKSRGWPPRRRRPRGALIDSRHGRRSRSIASSPPARRSTRSTTRACRCPTPRPACAATPSTAAKRARRLNGMLDVPYGPTLDEKLDIFPGRAAERAGVRLHPRRLLARLLGQGSQLRRPRPGGARHHDRRRRLFALPEGDDRRDHAPVPRRRRLDAAQHRRATAATRRASPSAATRPAATSARCASRRAGTRITAWRAIRSPRRCW